MAIEVWVCEVCRYEVELKYPGMRPMIERHKLSHTVSSDDMATPLSTFMGGNWLRGSDFKVGQRVKARVLNFEGVKPVSGGDPTAGTRTGPVYKVQHEGKELLFRLNGTNATYLTANGIMNAEDLVGKTLNLLVQSTQKGNALIITDVA
jgi:hypothetical protein